LIPNWKRRTSALPRELASLVNPEKDSGTLGVWVCNGSVGILLIAFVVEDTP
jgi:hypothetical protein